MDGSIARLEGNLRSSRSLQRTGHGGRFPCHGFIGARGAARTNIVASWNRVDILTGTFGKGLWAAPAAATSPVGGKSSPGCVSAPAPISFPTHCAAGGGRHLESAGPPGEFARAAARLHANARHFRTHMEGLGFKLLPGEHPIIPVMLGEAPLAVSWRNVLQERRCPCRGFAFPVVPPGTARHAFVRK